MALSFVVVQKCLPHQKAVPALYTLVVITFGTLQVALGQLSMGALLGFLQLASDIDGPIDGLTAAILLLARSKPPLAGRTGQRRNTNFLSLVGRETRVVVKRALTE